MLENQTNPVMTEQENPESQQIKPAQPVQQKRLYRLTKRLFDFTVALLLILLLAIPMLCVAVAVKVDSKGPVIFRQKRMGKGNRPFSCLKFRSMSVEAPHDCKTAELTDADRYITRIGNFIRRCSLDELPQLFNILVGQMSFVGPRPVVLTETHLLDLRTQNGAYSVKPGLTGLAQVSGRDLLGDEEKARLDAEYAHSASFLTDLRIMGRTFGYVLHRKDIQEGEQAVTAQSVSPQTNGYAPSQTVPAALAVRQVAATEAGQSMEWTEPPVTSAESNLTENVVKSEVAGSTEPTEQTEETQEVMR